MRKELVHNGQARRAGRRPLALLLACLLAFTLLPTAAFAAGGLTVVPSNYEDGVGEYPGEIYANGMTITLEAKGTGTVIKDERGNELSLPNVSGSTADGYDLSYYIIYGGCENDQLDGNTSVTMTGGTVRGIYGGGGVYNATVTGNTSVKISGGTVSGDAVCGGGKGPVGGSASVEISGDAKIQCSVYGGSKSYSGTVGGDSSVTISGGAITGSVYGRGGGEVTGSASVSVSGDAQVGKYSSGVFLNAASSNRGVDRFTVHDLGPDARINIELESGYDPFKNGEHRTSVAVTGAGESEVGKFSLVGRDAKYLEPYYHLDGEENQIRIRYVMPTVEAKYSFSNIYANGAALIIDGDSTADPTQTTVYMDLNRDGNLDEREKTYTSLATVDFDKTIDNAPADGADLSDWRVYGGSHNAKWEWDTKLTLLGGFVFSLCGGGLADSENASANVSGSTSIKADVGKTWKIYGGGRAEHAEATAHVGGDTSISIGGAVKIGEVFGGGAVSESGAAANVTGTAAVTVTGGQITTTLYGSGSAMSGTATVGKSDVRISGGTVDGGDFGNVYGGGIAYGSASANANVTGTAKLSISGSAKVSGSVYGGGDPQASGATATVGTGSSVTIGGGVKVGGEGKGIVLNGGTTNVANGVNSFVIGDDLTGSDGSVSVVLPEGYTSGTIATSAVQTDLAKIKLTGSSVGDKSAAFDSSHSTIIVKSSSAPPIVTPPTGSNTTNTTTSTTNADGSTTTTTTNKTTGTVTETTKTKDGTKTVVETKKDGSKTETVTTPDGAKIETATTAQGNMTYTEQRPDGTRISADIPKSGEATATVSLPSGTAAPVVASFPVLDGTVVLRLLPDGTQEPVAFSLVEDGRVYVRLDGDAELRVEKRAGLFDDMDGHWAEESADFTGARELFQGTAPNTFSPERPMTRAMLTTVLYRMDGTPAAGEAPFSDVENGSWCADGVAWAAENGIASGTGGGVFGAERSITRQELAVMLWNYAKYDGIDVSVGEDTNILSFTDIDNAGEWAIPALQWACGAGILQGGTDGKLNPTGSATRAQVAAMLERFVAMAVK